MPQGRYSSIYALALGLAVFMGTQPAAVQAAEPAGLTLWQARWQYVRLVPRDGGSPNLHPAELGRAEIRSGLAQLRLDMGDGEAVDFLTPEERGFCADQLVKALAKAGPDQDVVMATIGMRKTFIGLAEQKLTTIRAFVNQDGLNLVVGELQADVPNDTSTYNKPDPRLVSFSDGRRAASLKADAKWKLVANGAGVAVKRSDWATVNATAMATPEPGTPEAEKQVKQQVQELQQQVQQLRQDQRPAAPPALAAPVSPPAASGPAALEGRLRALDDLKAKGLVTPKEYAAKRKQILDSL